MRGLAVFLFVLVTISLFSFIALSSADDNRESEGNLQFKTFTSAVCENKDNLLYCKDELFVNCNGKLSKASEIKECNGFKIDNQVAGSAVFGKKWKVAELKR